MTYFFIYGISLFFLILIFSTFNYKKNVFLNVFKNIETSFKLFYKNQNNFIRVCFVIINIINAFIIFTFSTRVCSNVTNTNNNLVIIFLNIIMYIFYMVILYLALGIPFFILRKTNNFLKSKINYNLSWKLFISFLVNIFYGVLVFLGEKQLIKIKIIALITLIISYILNLEILINMTINPVAFIIKNKNSFKYNKDIFKNIWIGVLSLLVLIIFNLFLGVVMINKFYQGSYLCYVGKHNLNNIDLFYYTVITFTTIGYGDIVPVSILSKIMGIIIAFTSVFCLIIFIGSVISIKDKF